MGVYADLIAGAQSIDFGGADDIRHGKQRAIAQAIEALRTRQGGDIDYPSNYTARNEVQGIAVHEAGVDGGTYSLTFSLFGGVTFTTDALAFDADDAAIQTAVDDAADGVVDDYTAGDIAITGGPLTTTPVVITYSGASVASRNHAEVVINNIDLADGGVPEAAGDESVSVEGQSNRSALAVLRALGVLAGDPPLQGVSSTVTAGTVNATNPAFPGEEVIRALAAEAAIQDNLAALEDAILTAAGLS